MIEIIHIWYCEYMQLWENPSVCAWDKYFTQIDKETLKIRWENVAIFFDF